MIIKSLMASIGIFFSGMVLGDAPLPCSQEIAWQKVCLSGEMMQCNKGVIDSKNYTFGWRAINEQGQPFDIHGPYYKKVAGYIPAKCTVLPVKIEKFAFQN